MRLQVGTDLINESAHTSDDQDIGNIEAVSRNFIVVKKGFVNIPRYYIPLHWVEDGRQSSMAKDPKGVGKDQF